MNKINIKLADGQKENLLKGLDEIKVNSDPMSASEYCNEFISTYEEAFPQLKNSKNHEILKLASTGSMDESFENTINSYQNPHIKEALKYICENIESLKDIEDYILNNSNIYNEIIKIKSELDINNINDNWIEIKNDKVIIDWKKSVNLGNNLIEFYLDNKELVQGFVTFTPFLTTYFMYKNIVKAYDNSSKIDVKSTSGYELFQLNEQRLRSMRVFRIQAIFIALSLSTLSSIALYKGSSQFLEWLVKKKDENSMIRNSYIFPFLTKINKNFYKKIKDSNFIKLILLFFTFLIFMKFIFPIIKYNPDLNIFLIKLIVIIISSIFIAFYLFKLNFLVKYRYMNNKDIVISKNFPKFLQNALLEIKDISKFNSYYLFINLYLKTIIYMFTLLIFFIIISLFF